MLFVAFLLILVNGFFVATEFALVKVRATRIRQLAEQGNAAAVATEHMLGQLDAYLSACQVGITLASLALGWIGEPAFARLIRPWLLALGPWAHAASHIVAVVSAFILITVLHIVVGEQAPKIVAIARPESVALLVALPMRIFYRVFYPFVQLLNRATQILLAPLGLRADAREGQHTEEEARTILAESLAGGRDSEVRRRLVERAFEFAKKRARQFMIPRADIVFLDVERPLPENLETARRLGYTRYPIVQGSIDDVIGIVHIRDLAAAQGRMTQSSELRQFAREPLFVPEASPADVLLRQFQSRRLHQAIVVDEYGGTSGLVTLEDLLEELIGSEIQDEFDAGEAAPVLALGDGAYSVAGGFALEELRALLDVERAEDDEEDSVTVGGYVQNRLGRIGRVGDIVPLGPTHALRVLETRQRRVLRVLAGPRERVLLTKPASSPTASSPPPAP
jgi:CBS domain containing-hemolysin-like protein